MLPSEFLKSLIDDPPFLIALFKMNFVDMIILLISFWFKLFTNLFGLIFEWNKISLA